MMNNYTKVEMFLNRVKWDACSKKSGSEIKRFQIDCFCFEFSPPLENGLQYRFAEFLETIDLKSYNSVFKIGVWLLQNDVDFQLKFKWNRHVPIIRSIQILGMPKKLYRMLMENREEFLNYDLYTDLEKQEQS